MTSLSAGTILSLDSYMDGWIDWKTDRQSTVWAHEVSEVGAKTGTHAGLCLPDVCSVLRALSSVPLPPPPFSSLLQQSLFHTHSFLLFLLLTGPLKKNRAAFM